MLTLFFNCRGPWLIDWLPKGIIVNANHYAETLEQLRSTIKTKRRSMLSCGVILLHDNPRPHSWEAATLSVGRSSTSLLQSTLVPLWLSCVCLDQWNRHKKVCYGHKCTGSNHIMASLTAIGLLQTWYRQTCGTVGCLSQQPWGMCQMTWSPF